MFFYLSKILWFVIEPANLLLIGLCVAAALLILPGAWPRRWGRRLTVAVALFAVIVSILPFGRWMLLPLENRFSVPDPMPAAVDGIVVAGGAVDQFVSRSRGQVALNAAADRLTTLAELAARYPGAKLIYSAGSGDMMRQDVKEADVVGPFLARLGVEPERLILENRSRNTYENAVFTRELVDPRPGEVWMVVTSAFHMPRTVGAFRRAGWDVLAYPTDYHYEREPRGGWRVSLRGGLSGLSHGLHEWLGLIFYYATGRTDALFPGPD